MILPFTGIVSPIDASGVIKSWRNGDLVIFRSLELEDNFFVRMDRVVSSLIEI